MTAIFDANVLLTDTGSSGGSETAEGGTDRVVGFSQAAIDGGAERQLHKTESCPGAKQPPHVEDDNRAKSLRRGESCPDGGAAQHGRERPHISLCQVL